MIPKQRLHHSPPYHLHLHRYSSRYPTLQKITTTLLQVVDFDAIHPDFMYYFNQ